MHAIHYASKPSTLTRLTTSIAGGVRVMTATKRPRPSPSPTQEDEQQHPPKRVARPPTCSTPQPHKQPAPMARLSPAAPQTQPPAGPRHIAIVNPPMAQQLQHHTTRQAAKFSPLTPANGANAGVLHDIEDACLSLALHCSPGELDLCHNA
jgi:hypothetical protein